MNLLLILCLGASAVAQSSTTFCATAVSDAVKLFTFDDPRLRMATSGLCQGPLELVSLYAAAQTFCTESEITAGMQVIAGYCVEYGNTTLRLMTDFAPNLTAASIASMRQVGRWDVAPTDVLEEPVLINKEFYALAYLTKLSGFQFSLV
jgi:ferric-chelate reductase